MTRELSETLKKIDIKQVEGYYIDYRNNFLQINLKNHYFLVPYDNKESLLKDLKELKKKYLIRNEEIDKSKKSQLRKLFDNNKVKCDKFYKAIFYLCLSVILASGLIGLRFIFEPLKVLLSVGFMTLATSSLLVTRKVVKKKMDKKLETNEKQLIEDSNFSQSLNNEIIKSLETNIELLTIEVEKDIAALNNQDLMNKEDLITLSIELKRVLSSMNPKPLIEKRNDKRKRLLIKND